MSNLFGGGTQKKLAAKQAGEARVERQTANTEAMRSQQLAERGGASGGRGRNMLIGNLTKRLQATLGG